VDRELESIPLYEMGQIKAKFVTGFFAREIRRIYDSVRMGWSMGFEPAKTEITSPYSTK
jgi:hypothetical protein